MKMAEEAPRNVVDLLRSLNDVSRASEEMRRRELKRITDLGQKALNSQACMLATLNGKYITQEACTSRSLDFERHTGKSFRLGSTQLGDSLDYELIKKGELIEQHSLQFARRGVANPNVAKRFNLNSVLAHPLKMGSRLIGYLIHFSDVVEGFSDDQKSRLAILASYAAITIKRLEHNEDFERLFSIVNTLTQSQLTFSLRELYNQVAQEAACLLGVSTSILWKINEQDKKLKIEACHGELEGPHIQSELCADDECSGVMKLIRSRRPALLHEMSSEGEQYEHLNLARARGWSYLASVPMMAGERPLGMIDLYADGERHLAPWETEMLQTFADQAALVIERGERLSEAVIRHRKQERENLLSGVRAEVEREIIYGSEDDNKQSLHNILDYIAQKCTTATQAEVSFLRLWEKSTDRLTLKTSHPEDFARSLPSASSLKVGEGISGHVAETKRFYYSPNVTRDKRAILYVQHIGSGSALCVPIMSGEVVIGTISIASPHTDAFSPDVQAFMEGVADIVATAVMRLNLVGGLSKLAEGATNRSKTLDDLLGQLVELSRDQLSEPICLVWLLNKNRNGFKVAKSAMPKEAYINPDELFISNDSDEIKSFMQGRASLCLKNAGETLAHPYREKAKELQWMSMLAVPLTFQKQIIGILEMYSWKKERHFTNWQRRLFETLASQASLALENLTSRKRLERLNSLTREMAVMRDEGSLLRLLLKGACYLVGSKRGWINRLDMETGELKLACSEPGPMERGDLQWGEGLTGKCLELGRPIRVADVKNDPEHTPDYVEFYEDTRAELAVPILVNNAGVRVGRSVGSASKPIAVLNIESPTVGAFSQADEDYLWSLAGHVAIMLDSLESDRKQSTLTRVQGEVLAQKDWDSIIQIMSDGITDALGYSFVNVSLVSPERRRIKTRYVKGVEEEKEELFKKKADHSLNDKDIQADIVRAAGEPEVPKPGDPRFDEEIYRTFNHDQLIRVFVPMIASADRKDRRSVIGTVEAGYKSGHRKHIYEQDVKILCGFVEHAVRAMEMSNIRRLKLVKHEMFAAYNTIKSNVLYMQRRNKDENILTREQIEVKCNDALLDCESLKSQIEQLEYVVNGRLQPTRKRDTLIFKDVIIKVIKQLRPEVAARGLDFTKVTYRDADVHKIPSLYLEREKLSRVVINLLTNSIKYSDRDPNEFAIRIWVEENAKNFIIVFKDWGIGVREGYEERIFEEGVRTPEAIKEANGMGLGLTISLKIMQEMGGELLLVNRRKPTEFHMILPKRLGGS